MFRVNNKSTSSGVLIVNFKHFTPFSSAFNVHFEQVNVGWVKNSSGQGIHKSYQANSSELTSIPLKSSENLMFFDDVRGIEGNYPT